MNKVDDALAAANPEIGAIVHLEHLNFETPDHDMATVFFMNGLGLTRDPYQRPDENNMGVNIGMQQFHLPRRGERTPPFPGVVGLIVPDLEGVRERLDILEKRGKFRDTPYRVEEGRSALEVVSPFGYRLRLHQAGTLPFLRPLGLAYVDVPVPPGAADGIARFYADIMRAPVQEMVVSGERVAVVTMGPHQYVRFIETKLDDYETHSMHIAYYITNFSETRGVLERRFGPITDGGDDLLFFSRIFDPSSGETVFTINNEVRSLYHRDYMRPLINRWPIETEPFDDRTRVSGAVARMAAPR